MNARKTIVSATKSGFTFTESEFAISDNDIGYFYSYSQSYQAKYQRAKRNGSLAAKAAERAHKIEKGKAYLAFEKAKRLAMRRYAIWCENPTKANHKTFFAAQDIRVACWARYASFGLHHHASIPHLLSSCVLDERPFNPCADRLRYRGALLRAARGYQR